MSNEVPSINISTSTGFSRWKPAAWLRVTGPDAGAFLQGQFTNDLRALERQPAVYGLWLSVKGKVVADSFVIRGTKPDEFWIGSYASPAATVRERLESHIIADEVAVEDVTGGWLGVSLWGEAAAVPAAAKGVGFVFAGRRSRPANTEWLFPATAGDDVRRRLAGFPELDESAVLRGRIAAGIPLVPVDAGPADLPNEAGLEDEAISYQKGCYLGQEVMARLKSMGQVRRRLQRVRGTGPLPALPAALYAGAVAAGELRSAVAAGGDFIGLAMISLLKAKPDAPLALAPGGPPALQRLDPA